MKIQADEAGASRERCRGVPSCPGASTPYRDVWGKATCQISCRQADRKGSFICSLANLLRITGYVPEGMWRKR
jgi:hypothetical protein